MQRDRGNDEPQLWVPHLHALERCDVLVEQLGSQRALDGFFFGRSRGGGQHAPGGRQVAHVKVVGLDAHG